MRFGRQEGDGPRSSWEEEWYCRLRKLYVERSGSEEDQGSFQNRTSYRLVVVGMDRFEDSSLGPGLDYVTIEKSSSPMSIYFHDHPWLPLGTHLEATGALIFFSL